MGKTDAAGEVDPRDEAGTAHALVNAEEISEEKHALRRAASARRERLHHRAGAGAALRALDRFRERIALASRPALSAYLPVRSEFDVLPILHHAHAQGCPTGLPVVLGRNRPLCFRRWAPGDPLVDGTFGIATPSPDAETLDPEILLVPMLAFDEDGYRLGYGGGFYDRTLALRRDGHPATLAVGIAYAGQRVEHVPRAPGDQRLDWIVTEEGARQIERA